MIKHVTGSERARLNKINNNKKVYMAVDQCGRTYHGLIHPRKELCERLGVTSGAAKKMFINTRDNEVKHIGYVIAGLWLEVYQVLPFKP